MGDWVILLTDANDLGGPILMAPGDGHKPTSLRRKALRFPSGNAARAELWRRSCGGTAPPYPGYVATVVDLDPAVPCPLA